MAAAFILAVLGCAASILVYGAVSGQFALFNAVFTPVVLRLLFAIYLSTVDFSARRFLKKSVRSLIT